MPKLIGINKINVAVFISGTGSNFKKVQDKNNALQQELNSLRHELKSVRGRADAELKRAAESSKTNQDKRNAVLKMVNDLLSKSNT